MEHFFIRTIEPTDNIALAKIIRQTLIEFKANKPGTVYFDYTTDYLSDLFKTVGSIYFVAAWHGEILGGAGIYPTKNLPKGTCELVKLYLSPKPVVRELVNYLWKNVLMQLKNWAIKKFI